jgi:hypothetical protein
MSKQKTQYAVDHMTTQIREHIKLLPDGQVKPMDYKIWGEKFVGLIVCQVKTKVMKHAIH